MRNLVVREITKGENEKIKPYLERLVRDEVDVQSVISEFTLPGAFLEYDLHS